MQPPIEELVRGRPDSWLGLPVEWVDDAEPLAHFVQTLEVEGDVLYLLEAKYDIATVLVDGESFGDHGHFIEYFVVTGTAESGWTLHCLLQRGGLTYCAPADDEDPDTIPAGDPRSRCALP